MLHPESCGALRPIDVPILVEADGPQRQQVASRNGDGVFSASPDFLASDEH
jgi:hypothetical protein